MDDFTREDVRLGCKEDGVEDDFVGGIEDRRRVLDVGVAATMLTALLDAIDTAVIEEPETFGSDRDCCWVAEVCMMGSGV